MDGYELGKNIQALLQVVKRLDSQIDEDSSLTPGYLDGSEPTSAIRQLLENAAFRDASGDFNYQLNVILRPQETNMWCWAASGQMVMGFLGRPVSQCEQANRRFGYNHCCNKPTPGECANGGWPEFEKYGFRYSKTNGYALTYFELGLQIAGLKQPFAFSWKWNGGGGHMMVAKGVITVNGKEFVSIHDPWPPNAGNQRDITYLEYWKGPDHTHWDDYYNFSRIRAIGLAPEYGSAMIPGIGQPTMTTQKGVSRKEAIVETHNVANNSLETYRAIAIIKKEFEGGGQLSLGDPFPIVWVGLDELRNLPGGDPKRVLKDEVEKVLYPILVQNELRSAVTIQKSGSQWEASSYGDTTLARLLMQARQRYASEHKVPLSEFYALSIPALNAMFVVVGSGETVKCISVLDDPIIGLRAGEAQESTEVIGKLVEAARRHDGQPR